MKNLDRLQSASYPTSSIRSSSIATVAPGALHELMNGLGWHDIRDSVYQQDQEYTNKRIKFDSVLKAYELEQTSQNTKHLAEALQAVVDDLRTKLSYLKSQRTYYEKQAQQEAVISARAGTWGRWLNQKLGSVKYFFDSTAKQLVKKYDRIAQTHQDAIDQIIDFQETLLGVTSKHKRQLQQTACESADIVVEGAIDDFTVNEGNIIYTELPTVLTVEGVEVNVIPERIEEQETGETVDKVELRHPSETTSDADSGWGDSSWGDSGWGDSSWGDWGWDDSGWGWSSGSGSGSGSDDSSWDDCSYPSGEHMVAWKLLDKQVIGVTEYAGHYYNIGVQGNMTAIISPYRIDFFDVSEPLSITSVSKFNLSGIPFKIRMDSHIVGVAEGITNNTDSSYSITLVNMSNISCPSLMTQYHLAFPPNMILDFQIVGNYAHMITANEIEDKWNIHFQTVNISVPTVFSIIGNCNLGPPDDESPLNTDGILSFNIVYMVGTVAYVIGMNKGLQLIDVSTLSSPRLMTHYKHTQWNDYFSNLQLGETDTAYLFSDDKIIKLNISVPSLPKLIKSYEKDDLYQSPLTAKIDPNGYIVYDIDTTKNGEIITSDLRTRDIIGRYSLEEGMSIPHWSLYVRDGITYFFIKNQADNNYYLQLAKMELIPFILRSNTIIEADKHLESYAWQVVYRDFYLDVRYAAPFTLWVNQKPRVNQSTPNQLHRAGEPYLFTIIQGDTFYDREGELKPMTVGDLTFEGSSPSEEGWLNKMLSCAPLSNTVRVGSSYYTSISIIDNMLYVIRKSANKEGQNISLNLLSFDVRMFSDYKLKNNDTILIPDALSISPYGSSNLMSVTNDTIYYISRSQHSRNSSLLILGDLNHNIDPPRLKANYEMVGYVSALKIFNNVAYLVFSYYNNGVLMLDVSASHTPSLLGKIASAYASDIDVSNDIAYISAGSEGLLLFDVSHPHHPVKVGNYSSADDSSIRSVSVANQLAYVVDSEGLQIIDISDLSSLRKIGNFSALNAGTVRTMGNRSYLYDDYSSKTRIIDVSDPKKPDLMTNCNVNYYSSYSTIDSAAIYSVGYDSVIRFEPAISLSGNPKFADRRLYQAKVTATDKYDASASISFKLSINNNAPNLIGSIPNQIFWVGEEVYIKFPENLFEDSDGDRLVYAVTSAAEAPLPRGFSFDENTRVLTGQSDTESAFSLEVSVDDGYAGTAKDDFTLEIIKQSSSTDTLSYTCQTNRVCDASIATSVFARNANDLQYTARLANGLILPQWFKFDSTSLRFWGTPIANDAGEMPIKLSQSDGFGVSNVEVTFIINLPPFVNAYIPEQKVNVKQLLKIALSDVFSSPSGDSLTYSAWCNNQSLPDWISIDHSGYLRIEATNKNKDTFAISIAAEDTRKGKTLTGFNLTVLNRSPELRQKMKCDEDPNIGEKFDCVIASDAFADPDGDDLTYQAQLISTLKKIGKNDYSTTNLPLWLEFHDQTRTFSGKPSLWDYGVQYEINMTANDGQATTSGSFVITVDSSALLSKLFRWYTFTGVGAMILNLLARGLRVRNLNQSQRHLKSYLDQSSASAWEQRSPALTEEKGFPLLSLVNRETVRADFNKVKEAIYEDDFHALNNLVAILKSRTMQYLQSNREQLAKLFDVLFLCDKLLVRKIEHTLFAVEDYDKGLTLCHALLTLLELVVLSQAIRGGVVLKTARMRLWDDIAVILRRIPVTGSTCIEIKCLLEQSLEALVNMRDDERYDHHTVRLGVVSEMVFTAIKSAVGYLTSWGLIRQIPGNLFFNWYVRLLCIKQLAPLAVNNKEALILIQQLMPALAAKPNKLRSALMSLQGMKDWRLLYGSIKVLRKIYDTTTDNEIRELAGQSGSTENDRGLKYYRQYNDFCLFKSRQPLVRQLAMTDGYHDKNLEVPLLSVSDRSC